MHMHFCIRDKKKVSHYSKHVHLSEVKEGNPDSILLLFICAHSSVFLYLLYTVVMHISSLSLFCPERNF